MTIKTVGDLMAKLSRYNPELPVLRDTDDQGASGIESCRLIETNDPEMPAFVFIGPDEDEEAG